LLLSILPAFACGTLVGVALGLTGGGGSIFAVPLLVYALGVPPSEAIGISLVAVAATSLVGAGQAARHGLVVWQPSLLFALGGMLAAPLGAVAGERVDPFLLIVGFALLALIVGTLMWRAARTRPEQAAAVRALPQASGQGAVCVLAPDGQLRFTAPCAVLLFAVGVGTGFLSGLLGVGGGFLIVPALVMVTRMSVFQGVATSLAIISAIGFAGAVTAVWQGRVDWDVLAPFAAGGAVMMIVTRSFAGRIAGPTLQRAFAVSIVLVGAAMLAASLLGEKSS